MAERKAVNKYYPPDYDPRKGSINKHVGQHPLRDRAKKLSQGILVIRFEMPYNIWCGGCGSHIGMGVRYNAEKSKVGNYYSTPIYKFRMKCHLCDNYFEIQTDPQNHDYVILSGARRKEQRWDPKANEQIVPDDKATQKKLATDAMFKLEHVSDDQQRGKTIVSTLAQLERRRGEWKDDYLLNREARNKFRAEKKSLKEEVAADKALLEKMCLPTDIALAPETEEDKKMAGLLKYSVFEVYEEKQKERRKAIDTRPLFESPKSTATASPACLKQSQGESSDTQLKLKKLGLAARNKYLNPFDTSVPGSRLRSLELGIRRKSDPQQSKSENQPSSTSTESTLQPGCCDADAAEGTDGADNGDAIGASTQSPETVTDEQKRFADGEEEERIASSVVSSTEGNALNSLIAIYSDSDDET